MRTIEFTDKDIKECKLALTGQNLTSLQSAFLMQYIINLENIEKRLEHLLISNKISLYDRIDPKTKDYMYDITKFDDLYSKQEETKNNLTLTITLNDDQVIDLNNRIIEVKKDYESRINNTIDYVKDCLEHLCTVDEIEILNKLGYNKDTEE